MSKTRFIEPADPRPADTHTRASGLAAAVMKPAGRTPPSGQVAREQFERLRLAAFVRRGFAGEGRRIPDRAGRESYALARGTGPCPTVLVHGGVGNTIEWAEIAARLDGPVVIPDRPGFGLSHPHDYRRVDFRADAVRWLLELADGLGMEQIDLVGNSMGGFFAIAFAAAHPERVRRLILSGSPAGLFPRIGLFLHLWATPGIGALISRIKFRDIETLRKRAFGGFLTHPDRLPNDLLEVALAGINLPGTAATNRAILQDVATFRSWRPELRLNDALAAVEVPTLFVWGSKDQLAPADVGRELAERMSDARLVVIEDAGHIPHLDQPDAAATAINGFLREPASSSGTARARLPGKDRHPFAMTPPSPRPPSTMDWSLGKYEHTAAQLLPAAHAVVDQAAPAEGERVVDVGCGTGNAALLAAARGASATGVDPAPRLLEVAREQAAAQGLDAAFVLGEAAELPLEGDVADVVLSVFGVIFAPDAPAAAAEMARVTAPTGRIVLSAWVPEGAISEAVRAAQEAVRRAVGAPAGPPPFAWHDRTALAGLLAPHGFEVTMKQESLAFTAKSPRDYLDAESANHPLAVAGRAVLERSGEGEALRDRMLSIYEAANEDPDGFQVTSRYVVATARRR